MKSLAIGTGFLLIVASMVIFAPSAKVPAPSPSPESMAPDVQTIQLPAMSCQADTVCSIKLDIKPEWAGRRLFLVGVGNRRCLVSEIRGYADGPTQVICWDAEP